MSCKFIGEGARLFSHRWRNFSTASCIIAFQCENWRLDNFPFVAGGRHRRNGSYGDGSTAGGGGADGDGTTFTSKSGSGASGGSGGASAAGSIGSGGRAASGASGGTAASGASGGGRASSSGAGGGGLPKASKVTNNEKTLLLSSDDEFQ